MILVPDCCLQGFTTYYLYGDREIRHVSYFWKILERCFPASVKEGVKGLRMSKDCKGVVFDLSTDLSSLVKVSGKEKFNLVCVRDMVFWGVTG